MRPSALKLPFAAWLKATQLVAASDKTMSDNDLKAALGLPTLKAARQVRRQVRLALKSQKLDLPLAALEPVSADPPKRPSQDKPPITEWYAPHMT
jgi:hypothetical protein